MTKPIRDPESGSVTILLAASLMIFFSLAAIGVDIGFLYLAQRRAQAVADLAVLAGAAKYTTASTTAATNAVTAIETANGYTATNPTFPSSYRIELVLTKSFSNMFFGNIFGLTSKSINVTSVASAGNPIPAIWTGGNCASATGLQMNGGPFTINGSLVSYGPLNFYTSPGASVNGDVTNSNAAGCPAPIAYGVTGTTSSAPPATLPPDPFGYNIMTDFPACMFGTSLTVAVMGYNVPVSGAGVIAPGVYCNNGDINISSGAPTISSTGLTVLATGNITVSGNGLNITGTYPGAHNIAFFSTKATADCTTQTINLGFPGGVLDGNVYAPNGCFQISGGGYTLNGSIAGKEVQYGAGINWTINADTTGVAGSMGLYQ